MTLGSHDARFLMPVHSFPSFVPGNEAIVFPPSVAIDTAACPHGTCCTCREHS